MLFVAPDFHHHLHSILLLPAIAIVPKRSPFQLVVDCHECPCFAFRLFTGEVEFISIRLGFGFSRIQLCTTEREGLVRKSCGHCCVTTSASGGHYDNGLYSDIPTMVGLERNIILEVCETVSK